MAVSRTSSDLLGHKPSIRADVAAEVGAKSHRLVLLAVLVIGVFYVATIRQGHNWGDDFSMYIQHAKNIVEGAGYHQTSYLYLPPYIGPDSYPPVFPLFLTPVYWMFGLNLTAMKVALVLAFLAALLLFNASVRQQLSAAWQAALLAVIGFNPYVWDLKDQIESEIPFLVATYLGIFLVLKAYQSKPGGKTKLLYAVAIGCAFYLSYGTRSIGIVLLPCLFLYDLLRNRRLTLFPFYAAATAVALIVLQWFLLRSDRGYYDVVRADSQDFFYNWMRFIWINLGRYTASLTQLWDNLYSRPARLALTVVISGFALVGFLARLKKHVSFVEVFVPLYVTLVLIVPMDGGLRYLIPAVPFYMYYAVVGLNAFPLRDRARQGVLAVLAVAVLASYVAQYQRTDFKQVPDSITKAEAVEFFDYVNHRTGKDDVFIFTKPRALALFTGRKSSFYPLLLEDKQVWEYFRHINATHIVVGPKGVEPYDQAFLTDFVARYASDLREEYANADFKVYRITAIPKTMVQRTQGKNASL